MSTRTRPLAIEDPFLPMPDGGTPWPLLPAPEWQIYAYLGKPTALEISDWARDHGAHPADVYGRLIELGWAAALSAMQPVADPETAELAPAAGRTS